MEMIHRPSPTYRESARSRTCNPVAARCHLHFHRRLSTSAGAAYDKLLFGCGGQQRSGSSGAVGPTHLHASPQDNTPTSSWHGPTPSHDFHQGMATLLVVAFIWGTYAPVYKVLLTLPRCRPAGLHFSISFPHVCHPLAAHILLRFAFHAVHPAHSSSMRCKPASALRF